MIRMMGRRGDRGAGRHLRSRDGRLRRRLDGRMGGSPIGFEVVGDVLASVLQLILIEDDIKHLRWALGQLLGRHHLDVEVAALRLAPRFDQPLQHLVINKNKIDLEP